MAVTQVESLEDLLYQIQQYEDTDGVSYPTIAHLLPSDDQIIDIDLDTRKIDAPDFLSVQYDHNAEIVYFKCARYLGNMDLTNTVCIIQYRNAEHTTANGQTERNCGMFWVPYYDIDHYIIDPDNPDVVEPAILIPWSIAGLATLYAGSVEYSVRFYQLSSDKTTYIFNASTQIATGQVLHGMSFNASTSDGSIDLSELEIDTTEVDRIYSAIAQAKSDSITYWMDV